ncbi:hypothetical protein [Micromonospora chersina]|uniref:hypothetical protein n=1 Tax=Micromonospora chersina TaxID=47854 RepID=UPI00372113AF
MTDMVTWVSLVAAAILFILGAVDLVMSWGTTKATKDAVAKAAAVAESTNENATTLQEQSAVDFKGAWEALAALATAIKDLDRSARLLVLSLAFLAVAAVAAGAGEIAAAVS